MNTENEKLMTQYLLGELSDDQQLLIEEEFFKSDDAFLELQAIEDELRYDYSRGGLTQAQRRAFEQRFLRYPAEQERVKLARAVLDKVSEIRLTPERVTVEQPGMLSRLLKSFGLQMPALQLGMAAASILILAGGSWLLYRTLQLRSQVKGLEVASVNREQEQLKQVAEERGRADKLAVALENERRQREDLARELEQQRATARDSRAPELPASLSFALSPGQVRDGDGPKRLVVGSGVKTLNASLRLRQPAHYTSYRIDLQTTDGAQIWSRVISRSAGNDLVKVSFPARLVPPGDYVLSLKGRTASGADEDVDEYYLTVGRD